jgi:IclR family transcriptional regulator, blcABC operon repressor
MASISQAGKILAALDGEEGFVPFGELVRRTGLPKSSAHTVISELVKVRFLERGDGPVYRIGLRMVELASARINNMDVVRRFSEVTASWQGVPDESIVLSMLDGTDILYLAYRNGNRSVGIQYRIGMRLPAPLTASGKAILAWQRKLPESLTDSRLREELDITRLRGYSIDNEETAPGVICFGAPILPRSGDTVWCAVAISLIKASITPADYDQLGDEAMLLAKALR